MKTCESCGKEFTPSERAPWSKVCYDCFRAGKRPPTKSRASGGDRRAFAASYVKDLIVADKVKLEEFSIYAEKMYQWLIKDTTNNE